MGNKLSPEQIKQLLEVAKLAMFVVQEQGKGKASDELPHCLRELDYYLANELDDELWAILASEVFEGADNGTH